MTRTTAPDWTEAEDGWPRDEKAICRRARTLGIRKDPSRGYVRKCRTPTIWTPEKDEWFRAFVPGHTEREISAEHERLYGSPLTKSQIGNRKTTLGVKSGTHGGRFVKGQEPPNKGKTWDEFGTPEGHARSRATQFRRGQLPHNTRPLLDVRTVGNMGGETREIHVGLNRRKRANDQWIPLAQFNWMAANGRDWPDGCKAIHIDHDPLNDEADNIEPVPSDLWPLVMGAVPGQLEWHDRETLRTAVLYARVTRARVDSERRARIAAGKPRKGDLSHATTEND